MSRNTAYREDRFYKSSCTFLDKDGNKHIADVYSYSTKTRTYDIVVPRGGTLPIVYRTNSRKTECKVAHCEIALFFALEIVKC